MSMIVMPLLFRINQYMVGEYEEGVNSTSRLLAMSFHPLNSSLLYMLYGLNYTNTSITEPFSEYNLVLWNEETYSHLMNHTITDFTYEMSCQMKVTAMLMLIQSKLSVLAFAMNGYDVNISSYIVKEKNPPLGNHISIQADAIDNLFVYASNTSIQTYELVSSEFILKNSFRYSTTIDPDTLSRNIFSVNMRNRSTSIIFSNVDSVAGTSQVYYQIVDCTECMFNTTHPVNYTILNLGYNKITYDQLTWLRQVDGRDIVTSASVTWQVDNIAAIYCFEVPSCYQFHFYVPNITEPYNQIQSNSEYLILYGMDTGISAWQFSVNGTASFIGTFNFKSLTNISVAAISANSDRLAVYSFEDHTWPQLYETLNASTCPNGSKLYDTYFCQCRYYDRLGKHCTAGPSPKPTPPTITQEMHKGLPMYAYIIIGVACLLVITGVVIIIWKKVIQPYGKKPHGPRKAWNYDPVDNISFQL